MMGLASQNFKGGNIMQKEETTMSNLEKANTVIDASTWEALEQLENISSKITCYDDISDSDDDNSTDDYADEFDDDDESDDDDCDNYYAPEGQAGEWCIPPESQTKLTTYHSIGNQKTRALGMLVSDLIHAGKLKATAGGQLFRYDADIGCYRSVSCPEKLVSSLLDQEGYFYQLGVKEIRDICVKILWDPSAQFPVNNFNSYPGKINTYGGIIDYIDGTVSEHSEEMLYTYSVNAKYLEDPALISCPTFENFCNTSLAALETEDDKETVVAQKRTLLLEMIGYICCDSCDGKCALFLKGEGDSGKSVLASFVTKLFDPGLVSNIQLNKLSSRFNVAELYGKKLNVAGEMQGKPLSEIATFKSITGSDDLSAERKGKDPFSFKPRCKLLFSGNCLPSTTENDTTKAFVNRLVVLLFNHSIPKERQDKELLNKLWEERDSIFTLAVHALRDLHFRNYQFTIPDESREFLNSFLDRGNSLRAFLQDCCVLGAEERTYNTDLLAAYNKYCLTNGLDLFTRNKLMDMLSGIPGVSMRRFRMDGQNRWGHIGIGLKKEYQKNGTVEQD